MRYIILSAGLLLVCQGIIWLWLRKTRPTSLRIWLLLIGLTLLFNSILTGLPIVVYNANNISGLRVGTIPIEDFSYTIAVLWLMPRLYQRFNKKPS
ncbi:hypothetical protein IT414_03495 [bacterium]|nr:hypothetical protein [bacterium]